MPGYFLHGLCCNQRGLGMLYVTVRPGDNRIYRDTQPILGFPELPVSTMFEVGRVSMPIDEVVAMVSSKDPSYTEFYVQCNYNGGLDLSLRVGGEGPYSVYELILPPSITQPAPTDWDRSMGKRFVRFNYDFSIDGDDELVYPIFD